MGGSISTVLFLMFVCVATAIAACWLFMQDEKSIASVLTLVCMASCAKLMEAMETPYERGLAEANLVLNRNRRTR